MEGVVPPSRCSKHFPLARLKENAESLLTVIMETRLLSTRKMVQKSFSSSQKEDCITLKLVVILLKKNLKKFVLWSG